jgi:hypothetical protein
VLEPRGHSASPGAALSREVGTGAVVTHGSRAALSRKVGTGAAKTRSAPGAALSREVGTGVAGTHGGPEAAPSRYIVSCF